MVKGWSGREQVYFPQPLGKRWVYYVVDTPDYFLQPFYFNAKSVDFKIGSEIDFLNRLLEGTEWIKQILHVRNLDAFVPFFRFAVFIASFFGTTQGGVMVKVTGKDKSGPKQMEMSAFAGTRGEIIPAILPSLAAQMILANEVNFSGIATLSDWLPKERFIEEFRKRGVEVYSKGSQNMIFEMSEI